ncbi:uncharacterized protein TM35_000332120 [Trypanosoma theileri]|uniref:Abnormal spindle-like microcephaly-associated protein ASH domain-containing protein n=1 Tax=Trypanosoma theileri TaxID=67003 RepID=A0A1X0NM10_9TRYP|nr:uncharacterized protein TM35_000332120 [Trypanosoma theileri]ORC85755.1 hypothetical protein TM35_000332120 [Trypanosoma theileri]
MDPADLNPTALLESAWTSQAMDLFADELHDLESLEKEEDVLFQAELQRIRERPPETVAANQTNTDPNTTVSEKKDAGHQKKNSVPSRRGMGSRLTSHVSASGASKAALMVAAARNASRLTKEKETDMIKAREREFWQVVLRTSKQQAQQAREVSELHSANAQRQEEFFSAHGIEEYMMDDVLRGAPKESPKTISTKTRTPIATVNVTSDEICNKYDDVSETQTPLVVSSTRPMSGGISQTGTEASKVSLRPTFLDENELDRNLDECEFIIDAVGFANDLNLTLEKEYGFRPALVHSPDKGESSSSPPPPPPPLTLEEKLLQHTPGDGMNIGGASWNPTLPPLKRKSDEKFQKRQMNTFPTIVTTTTGTAVAAGVAEGGHHIHKSKIILPSLNTTEGDEYPSAKATGTTPFPSERSNVSSHVTTLECTAVDNCVKLRTTAGLEASTVVRFINRDPKRLRLRVRPSNHAWITYSIVNSSLGTTSLGQPSSSISSSSIATPSSVCTTISAPLVCGGFIDIRITFEPQSSAEPFIEQVLQLGYCRELNSRRGEGAKWNFFEVTVLCETILPQFRLIPMFMGGEEGSAISFPLTTGTNTTPTPTNTALTTATVPNTIPNSATSNVSTTITPSNSVASMKTTSVVGKRYGSSRIMEEDVSSCDFPYTFLMNSCTRWYYLENIGSDAVISLRSSSPYFKVSPTPETTILLPGGDRVEIAVCFAPMEEARYETERLFIVVRDFEDGPIIAEHHFGLRGEGVLPKVELIRIGSMELTPQGKERKQQEEEKEAEQEQQQLDKKTNIPQYLVPDTTPGVETEVIVELRNTCPIPLPYYWITETIGGTYIRSDPINDTSKDPNDGKMVTIHHHDNNSDPSGVRFRVTPVTGILAPHKKTSFRVCMQPSRAFPFAAVVNLFLEGLPEPPEGEEEEVPVMEGVSPLAVANVMTEYSRRKTIPALPNHNQVDQMSDPYCVFQYCSKVQPKENRGVFATGFYLFADPVVPSFVIVPDHLEEGVECLVQYENVRRITLQNNSSRPLHFVFDPKPEECPPEMVLSPISDREDIEVKFQPRKGCVQPNSSVTVTFRFILRAVDYFSLSIDCYIPELVELLRDTRRATTLGISSLSNLRCTHQLHLSVTGVGPSVRTSTDFLDFGLIEEGSEGEASFTVTNDNPIPVLFDLQDPMMREPRRFVFLPPSFRLGAGESVEVTVYRQAVETGDSQTFFELVVRGGGTIAIETRATIQRPLLILQEAVVNYGVVPDGAWVEENFILSNTSAFDIPYSVETAVVPPYLQVSLPPPGVIQAGHHGISIPVRCVFSWKPGNEPYEGLLRINNGRTQQQQLLLELCCDSVQQLTVSLDLIPIPKVMEGSSVMACTPPVLPYTLPPPPIMDIASFMEALLWNLVEVKVFHNDVLSVDKDSSSSGSRRSYFTTDIENETANVNTLMERKEPPLMLRPYCPPVVLKAHLPDWEPVWSELMVLRLKNTTGCRSSYSVEAMCYTPETMIEGTETDGKRIMNTSFKTTQGGNRNTRITMPQFTQGHGEGKELSSQQKQGNSSPLSSSRGTGKGNTMMTKIMGTEKHAFWCKSVDGTEQRERERRAALVDAQNVLLDGRGCATVFGKPIEGSLQPYGTVLLPLSICANLPGLYEEKLQVSCCKIPPTQIPIKFELTGKPLLFDFTTAGYNVIDGKQVLLMPSVIAGLGRSRRTVSLVNRVPRDLNVSVQIFLSAMAFCVVAVDDNVEAGEVTLRLDPITEEQQKLESKRNGRVSASPGHFLLPCMSTKVVTLEFTPDAAFVPKQSWEREWRGGAIITAEIAETPFNDSFLIDEFYRIHAEEYPAQRVFKRKRFGESEPAWMKSIVRPIAMLKVKQPFLSRPGVLKKNVILSVGPRELSILKNNIGWLPNDESEKGGNDNNNNNNNNNGSSGNVHSRNNSNKVSESSIHEDSSDKDEEEEEYEDNNNEGKDDDGVRRITTTSGTCTESELDELHPHNQVSRPPIETILAGETERKALRAYIAQRRVELTEQCKRYFIPTELELQAQCGVAQLDVEPSSSVIRFPKYLEGEYCRQSIRLTNTRCATIDFLLDLPSPSFRIVSAEFISMNSDHEELEVDDEEASLAQRAMESLKWSSFDDRQKAQQIVERGKRRRTGDTAKMEVTISKSSLSKYRGQSSIDTELVSTTRYRLRPYDAFDITVEYNVESREELDALLRSSNEVETTLNILFLTNSDTALNDANNNNTAADNHHHNENDRHIHSPQQRRTLGGVHGGDFLIPPLVSPVTELRQVIPLAVTLSTPSVSCNPPMLWFRPWQLVHDGRPQPSYVQKIQLLNAYLLPVHFEIVPRIRLDSTYFLPTTTSITTTATIQPNSNHHYPHHHSNNNTNTNTNTNSNGRESSKSRQSGTNRPTPRILPRERQLKEMTHYWDSDDHNNNTAPLDVPTSDGHRVSESKQESQQGKGESLQQEQKEEKREPPLMEGSSRFIISPLRGIIPAATRGGQPGVYEISVEFNEYANVRFEAIYDVLINNRLLESCSFLLRGDSRETEI